MLKGINLQRRLPPVFARLPMAVGPEIDIKKSTLVAIRSGKQQQFARQIQRTISATFSGNRVAPVCDEAGLSRFISMDYARKIYRAGAGRIVARNPDLPPSELGLLAVIAYTSGPLHQKITDLEHPHRKLRHHAEMSQIAEWKALIAQTILRIEKSPAPVVRRNMQLGIDDLAGYAAGALVRIDRLTSVTCAPKQVYTGGNTDIVIHTSAGVVLLTPLSPYAGSEAEGMLDPGTTCEVLDVIRGKENGRPSLDELRYPSHTIILREQ